MWVGPSMADVSHMHDRSTLSATTSSSSPRPEHLQREAGERGEEEIRRGRYSCFFGGGAKGIRGQGMDITQASSRSWTIYMKPI